MKGFIIFLICIHISIYWTTVHLNASATLRPMTWSNWTAPLSYILSILVNLCRTVPTGCCTSSTWELGHILVTSKVFFLYCPHIISVNVFHVETGKQTIHKKEKKTRTWCSCIVMIWKFYTSHRLNFKYFSRNTWKLNLWLSMIKVCCL